MAAREVILPAMRKWGGLAGAAQKPKNRCDQDSRHHRNWTCFPWPPDGNYAPGFQCCVPVRVPQHPASTPEREKRIRRSNVPIGVLLTMAFAVGTSRAAESPLSSVLQSSLGNTRNVHTCGSLFLAGQPSPADIGVIREQGIKCVITLRTDVVSE